MSYGYNDFNNYGAEVIGPGPMLLPTYVFGGGCTIYTVPAAQVVINEIMYNPIHSGGGTNDDGGSQVPGGPNSGTLSNISNAGIDNTGTLKTDGSVSGTNANLPPFLALAFIIRTS